jgi:hypothetical protein
MRNEQALVVCAFGWGKEFRLYRETLYVANTTYRLTDLTGVQLVRRQALGVPSARLELQFGRKMVVLRGIAAVEEAGRAAEYLATWCEDRAGEADGMMEMRPFMLSLPSLPLPLSSPSVSSSSSSSLPFTTTFHERVTNPVETPLALAQRKERYTEIQRGWRRERKTEHLGREKAQKEQKPQATLAGRDERAARALRDELPVVTVPVRLAEGEQAYFSVKATHCGERISETLRSTYPAQDHGLLILTNRRMLYIGRKSQMVLEYRHLLRLARLQGALAFEADHWQKRAIFTLSNPEACAACLEAILQKNSAPAGSGERSAAPEMRESSTKVMQKASEVYHL